MQKKHFISVLVVLETAASLFFCTGCQKNAELSLKRIPVELTAVFSSATRSHSGPVDSDMDLEAGLAGWEYNVNDMPERNVRKEDPAWSTPVTIKAAVSGDLHEVVIHNRQYYNLSADTLTLMRAWYPLGCLSPRKDEVTFRNEDGDVDLLISRPVSGNGTSRAVEPLRLSHVTSQINFLVRKGPGLADGVLIRSIAIQEVALPVGLCLATGEPLYTEPRPFEVRGIPDGFSLDLADRPCPAGNPVMMKPLENRTFKITIKTDSAVYEDIVISVSKGKVLPGHAYDIVLTFRGKDIGVSAVITEWKSGYGHVDVKSVLTPKQ